MDGMVSLGYHFGVKFIREKLEGFKASPLPTLSKSPSSTLSDKEKAAAKAAAGVGKRGRAELEKPGVGKDKEAGKKRKAGEMGLGLQAVAVGRHVADDGGCLNEECRNKGKDGGYCSERCTVACGPALLEALVGVKKELDVVWLGRQMAQLRGGAELFHPSPIARNALKFYPELLTSSVRSEPIETEALRDMTNGAMWRVLGPQGLSSFPSGLSDDGTGVLSRGSSTVESSKAQAKPKGEKGGDMRDKVRAALRDTFERGMGRVRYEGPVDPTLCTVLAWELEGELFKLHGHEAGLMAYRKKYADLKVRDPAAGLPPCELLC